MYCVLDMVLPNLLGRGIQRRNKVVLAFKLITVWESGGKVCIRSQFLALTVDVSM